MNDQSHEGRANVSRSSATFLSIVIAVAIVGYFVGINDGVPREGTEPVSKSLLTGADTISTDSSTAVLPAVTYSEMRRRETGPTSKWNASLQQIPQPAYDPSAEIKPSEAEKRQSTLTRASRRAFNGAPPVISHAVADTSDAACNACHANGMRIGEKVANRMSHAFLANCTQCHAPPAPAPFADVETSFESTFVGLPAPLEGKRAFPGAPPTIPHSTWMREKCDTCHSGPNGWAGMESTHPWRTNCTQCHAPSSALEQAFAAAPVAMLPGPVVSE